MGFNDVTVEHDDSRDSTFEQDLHEGRARRAHLADVDDLPHTLWSKAGPPVVALGLLVIAVAIGSYIGLRTADDSSLESASWPRQGHDTSTAPEEERPAPSPQAHDGGAEQDGEGNAEPAGDGPAGSDGEGDAGLASADQAAEGTSDDPAKSRASDEDIAEPGSGSSSSDSQEEQSDEPAADPEDCDWAPPGRPDHPRGPDRGKDCD